MKITEKVKIAVAALAVLAMSVVALPVHAADTKAKLDASTAQTHFSDKDDKALMNTLNTIINVAIGLIGFVAVVVIILGGVQYTTSAGDAGKVKKAKDTIMYGIIGLVIALLAFAIVNFILGNVFK